MLIVYRVQPYYELTMSYLAYNHTMRYLAHDVLFGLQSSYALPCSRCAIWFTIKLCAYLAHDVLFGLQSSYALPCSRCAIWFTIKLCATLLTMCYLVYNQAMRYLAHDVLFGLQSSYALPCSRCAIWFTIKLCATLLTDVLFGLQSSYALPCSRCAIWFTIKLCATLLTMCYLVYNQAMCYLAHDVLFGLQSSYVLQAMCYLAHDVLFGLQSSYVLPCSRCAIWFTIKLCATLLTMCYLVYNHAVQRTHCVLFGLSSSCVQSCYELAVLFGLINLCAIYLLAIWNNKATCHLVFDPQHIHIDISFNGRIVSIYRWYWVDCWLILFFVTDFQCCRVW